VLLILPNCDGKLNTASGRDYNCDYSCVVVLTDL